MDSNLKKGTLLHNGAYQIEATLGQGSFGVTYLAQHIALGRKVAIKEFFMKAISTRASDGTITTPSENSMQTDYLKKFRIEAKNLSTLEHDNIVRVTDCFDENGTCYYVMDYIKGENLNDYITKLHQQNGSNKQEAILSEALSIIEKVSSALTYMHDTKRMLHLDLKPGNIMRRMSDGHIYLIDFGLSKHYTNNGSPETSTTIGLGTPGYAPLEQGNGSIRGAFKPTIDVYALGATLFKLLTGQTPPVASDFLNDETLLTQLLLPINLSKKMMAVMTKAMSPSATKRYQSVTEFLNELQKASKAKEDMVKPIVNKVIAITKKPENLIVKPIKKSNKTSKVVFIIVSVIVALGILGWLGNSTNNNQSSIDTVDMTDTVVNIRKDSIPITYCYDEKGNKVSTANKEILGYYIGELNAQGMPNGDGQIKYADGRRFNGMVENGKMKEGTFTFPNGDTYEGIFYNNHFSKGTYTIKENGEYFIGIFNSKGQPKKGVWYNKNGKKIQ